MVSKGRAVVQFLSTFIFSISVTHAQETIYIHGKIENADGVVYLTERGELSEFKTLSEIHDLNLNDRGEFEITLSLESEGYYQIGFNTLYFEPGDSILALIDFQEPTNSSFSGRGAEKQNYLKSIPFPGSGSYLDGGRNIYNNCSETIDHILFMGSESKLALDSLIGVSENFWILEQARIRADLINSLFRAPSYYLYVHKIEKDSVGVYIEKFQRITDTHIEYLATDFADTRFLQLPVYRRILSIILDHPQINADAVSGLQDWGLAHNIHRELVQGVESNDSTVLANIPQHIEEIENPIYEAVLKKSFNALTEFKPGKPAVDFKIEDGSGRITNLSDYEGKVIYIDFWATWCAPCIEERPNFQHLASLYDGKDVAFISLSLDHDRVRWREFVIKSKTSRTSEGLINPYSMPEYNVVYLPRYVVIDSHFNLVDLNAPKPSSPEIKELLDKLL